MDAKVVGEEEILREEAGARGVSGVPKKGQRALAGVSRELSDEELGEPGTQKMLVAANDRLEEEVADLREFRDRYHDADKKVARLEERIEERSRRRLSQELLQGAGLTLGALLIGYVPNLEEGHRMMVFGLGALLVIAGWADKVLRLRSEKPL